MTWVRANVKLGARLSLFAMVLQLVLTLGHFHIGAIHTEGWFTALSHAAAHAAGAEHAHEAEDSQNHSHGPRTANDLCALCTIMALAGTGLPAAASGLIIPLANSQPGLPDVAQAAQSASHTAFRSRAPPLT
ncbi:MAG TPA: hypothetical protein VNZ94_12750 [Xanthobacteraceae bacterium]|nr:hypothetical protein [Xanthobacteraceae bacterium]